MFDRELSQTKYVIKNTNRKKHKPLKYLLHMELTVYLLGKRCLRSLKETCILRRNLGPI